MTTQLQLPSYTAEALERLARCLAKAQAQLDEALENRKEAQAIYKEAKAARDMILHDWCKAKEATEA